MGRRGVSALIALLLPMAASWSQETRVDPSRPWNFQESQTAPNGKRTTWTLTFIRISADKQTARINGVLVTPGQEVDGFRVARILSDAVEGRVGERMVRLTLGGGVARRGGEGGKDEEVR